ncbi:putative metabolite uptake ABC transporter, permease protein [Listeria floridensis FSL S10-1187]|uniref:Metabolite uptake ABC transporter, permease protein n=1 Tax=Listeria floridensis FSL S10-1187 TaxID=1265817 RepID=A0ABN0RCJ6_9LIST|nr:FtsX-like permease family protein [Listeria floridensis]EUJ27421.1 putative metabolite uptake ABC transporter, permease protein [Listeria floridensis FSL S10-1187]
MKKRALWKDIRREIWHSKSRFFSILALIMLGVAFFVGIKATGPDMIETADRYYKDYKLADFTVQSTYGLNGSDQAALENLSGVKQVDMQYTADLLLGDDRLVMRLYSYQNSSKKLNQYKAASGRLPKKSGEITLDASNAVKKKIKLGDKVTFFAKDGSKLTDTLKRDTYRVVGFVESPMYIEKSSRGTSTIGNGSTDAFAVIPQGDFDLEVYTAANIQFSNLTAKTAFSDGYEEAGKANKKKLKKLLEAQAEKRVATIKKDGFLKLDEAEAKLKENEQKLAEGETKLKQGKAELDAGFLAYQNKRRAYKAKMAEADREIAAGEAKLAAAKETIAQSKKDITEGSAQLEQAEQQAEAGKAQLEEAKRELAEREEALQTAEQFLNEAKAQTLVETVKLDPELTELYQIEDGTLYVSSTVADELRQVSEPLYQAIKGGQNLDEAETLAAEFLTEAKQELATGKAALEKEEAKLAQAVKTLEAKKAELAAGKAQLAVGERDYAAGVKQIEAAKKERERGAKQAESEFSEALQKLDASKQTYAASEAKFQAEKLQAEQKIAKARRDLTVQREKLETLEKPSYYVLDRSNNPGYGEYKENADRLASLSTIFPVFFFLIAALVCLTTMTRMVEEQRTQIGTLKALGYSNGDIMKKFLVYGSFASILGTGIGLLIGYRFFPAIIFDAYGMMYQMPPVELVFYPSYSIIALVVALICTTATAFAACTAELRSNAATLMRPKAPKQGKRILLERIGFIWNHMNFSSKVTARNIFRYKQRMLMTVIGVAGCTALILTGFGLRDSISDIAKLQYGSVIKYDALVSRDKTASKTEKLDYDKLMQDGNITSRMQLSMKSMDTVRSGKSSQQIQLATLETTKGLDKFVRLQDRKTKERQPLRDDGVVITEKLAKLLDLKVGETLVLKDTDHEEYRFKVRGIAENYAGHYVYVTKTGYERAFQSEPVYDSDLLNLKDTSKAWQNQFAEKLMDEGGVLAVTFSNTISGMLTDMLKSLNIVMVVLIVSAAILAFIVLYNLTNINVSERIRELSTIKVLGFYPKEVTMYVYRENIILTVLGILVGFIFGFFLHQFVIQTAEVDNMMFSPTVTAPSYLYSAILTLLFSTIVMLVMHVKLKRIDMIEALKSVE